MIDKEKWDADWDDIIDPTEPADHNFFTECVLCGCTPKPDEWSAQVENACIDCM